MRNKPYTIEQLEEWIKKFKTRLEMRKDNQSMYKACLNKNMTHLFPPKVNRYGNETLGEGVYKSILEEQKSLKQAEREIRVNKKKVYKRNVERTKDRDRTLPSIMYRGEFYEDGTIKCGRCLETFEKVDMSKHNTHMCHKCYNNYINFRKLGICHNKWNVKDEFCHIRIREGHRQIYIGIKTDERLEKWLRAMGYGFIFKEEYEK